MPEWKRRKVIIEVETTNDSSDSYGEVVDDALKPIQALPGVKVRQVRVEER
jgi:hypothetical protein